MTGFEPASQRVETLCSTNREKTTPQQIPNAIRYAVIEVAIARLVEQRVSTLCEAGSNPVIALKFFTEVLCIITVG